MIRDKAKHDLYSSAFDKTIREFVDSPTGDIKPIVKKIIAYGVKSVNSKNEKPNTRAEAEYDFQCMSTIKSFMATLTPNEFVNLFPIRKDFDGHKCECKDYFYTVECIEKLSQNEPIGEKIDDFLWDYTNLETSIFLVKSMGCVDNLRRFDGQCGMVEEFFADKGIGMKTLHTDSNGKEFLFDKQSGKTTLVTRPKKRRPKWIKAVR